MTREPLPRSPHWGRVRESRAWPRIGRSRDRQRQHARFRDAGRLPRRGTLRAPIGCQIGCQIFPTTAPFEYEFGPCRRGLGKGRLHGEASGRDRPPPLRTQFRSPHRSPFPPKTGRARAIGCQLGCQRTRCPDALPTSTVRCRTVVTKGWWSDHRRTRPKGRSDHREPRGSAARSRRTSPGGPARPSDRPGERGHRQAPGPSGRFEPDCRSGCNNSVTIAGIAYRGTLCQ